MLALFWCLKIFLSPTVSLLLSFLQSLQILHALWGTVSQLWGITRHIPAKEFWRKRWSQTIVLIRPFTLCSQPIFPACTPSNASHMTVLLKLDKMKKQLFHFPSVKVGCVVLLCRASVRLGWHATRHTCLTTPGLYPVPGQEATDWAVSSCQRRYGLLTHDFFPYMVREWNKQSQFTDHTLSSTAIGLCPHQALTRAWTNLGWYCFWTLTLSFPSAWVPLFLYLCVACPYLSLKAHVKFFSWEITHLTYVYHFNV